MSSTPLSGHWLSAHCLFSLSQLHVRIVDIVPCSNNDRFLRVNTILLLKNSSNKYSQDDDSDEDIVEVNAESKEP